MNNPSENTRFSAAGLITAAALIAIFFYSFVNSLMSVLVNEVVEGFSLTGIREGMMSSMVNLGLMLALLGTPLIQGRAGKLTMLVLSCALQAAMLLACGLSPVFALFCVSCVLLGVGGGVLDAYANSSLVDVRGAQSPRYLGYMHGLFGVGSLLAPLLVTGLLRVTDWRGVHFAVAAAMLAATVAVGGLSRLAGGQRGASAVEERPLNRADLAEYIRNPRNRALLLAGACASATQTGILVWVVRYMTLRFDAGALGTLSLTAFWVCATVNRFCIAQVKVRPMKLFAVGALCCAVFLAVGVGLGGPVAMCVMMGAIGLSTGHFMQVLFSECAVGYAGKTTFTTSAMMFVMGVVRVLVPLAMALVSSSLSVVTGMLIPSVLALLAATFGFLVVRISG